MVLYSHGYSLWYTNDTTNLTCEAIPSGLVTNPFSDIGQMHLWRTQFWKNFTCKRYWLIESSWFWNRFRSQNFWHFSAFPSIQLFFNGLVLFFPHQIEPSAHRGTVNTWNGRAKASRDNMSLPIFTGSKVIPPCTIKRYYEIKMNWAKQFFLEFRWSITGFGQIHRLIWL